MLSNLAVDKNGNLCHLTRKDVFSLVLYKLGLQEQEKNRYLLYVDGYPSADPFCFDFTEEQSADPVQTIIDGYSTELDRHLGSGNWKILHHIK